MTKTHTRNDWKRAEVGKFYKPPLFFNNGGPEGFSERRSVSNEIH